MTAQEILIAAGGKCYNNYYIFPNNVHIEDNKNSFYLFDTTPNYVFSHKMPILVKSIEQIKILVDSINKTKL